MKEKKSELQNLKKFKTKLTKKLKRSKKLKMKLMSKRKILT